MTLSKQDIRAIRHEHQTAPARPRAWRDEDHCATDDSGIIAALRAENERLREQIARMEGHIINVQDERRQLRALLDCQLKDGDPS